MLTKTNFLIMTNETATREEYIKKIRKLSNVLVTVSVEGDKEITDKKRGKGVYERVVHTLRKLKEIAVLFGISVSIERNNYRYWIKSSALEKYLKWGLNWLFSLSIFLLMKMEKKKKGF